MGNQAPKEGNFDQQVREVISKHNIEPWHARSIIKEKLERQSVLARKTPLKEISVEDGLKYFSKHSSKTIDKKAFVKICSNLLDEQKVWTTPGDRDELNDVFKSMDFDGSGELDRGEWAGGLSVYFKGSQEQAVHAVFGALDKDGSKTLDKKELGEYLAPVVKAMIPPEGKPLTEQLIHTATEKVYAEMDADKQGGVSADEMVEWSKHGNNLVAKLADIIDKEVYRLWLAHREQARGKENGKPGQGKADGGPGSNAGGQDGAVPDKTQQGPMQSNWQQMGTGAGPPPPGQSMPPGAWGTPGQTMAPGQSMPQGAWQQGPPGQTMMGTNWQQPPGPPGQSMAPGGWQQGPPGQMPAGQTMPFASAAPPSGFSQTQGLGGPPQQGFSPTQGPNPWQQTQMGGPWPQQPSYPDTGFHNPAHDECGCINWPCCGANHGDDDVSVSPSPPPQQGSKKQKSASARRDKKGQRPGRDCTVWAGSGWGDSSPEGEEIKALVAEGRDWRTDIPESYPWNIPPPPPPPLRNQQKQGRLESQGSPSLSGRKADATSPAFSSGTTAAGESWLSSAPYTPCSTYRDLSLDSPRRAMDASGNFGSPGFKSSGAYQPRLSYG